jgi:hypothetical protein
MTSFYLRTSQVHHERSYTVYRFSKSFSFRPPDKTNRTEEEYISYELKYVCVDHDDVHNRIQASQDSEVSKKVMTPHCKASIMQLAQTWAHMCTHVL